MGCSRSSAFAHTPPQKILSAFKLDAVDALVSSKDGDAVHDRKKESVLQTAGITAKETICPKKRAGNLFAAAGLLQVALGAALTDSGKVTVLATCFGHGSTQAAFLLTAA
jgi:hypothetical protein